MLPNQASVLPSQASTRLGQHTARWGAGKQKHPEHVYVASTRPVAMLQESWKALPSFECLVATQPQSTGQ